MSVEKKVGLARRARGRFGLSLVLGVLGLARSTYYYHEGEKQSYERKYAQLRGALEKIARSHPEYGYRRATTELRVQTGEVVNRKVVQKLHRLWDLPLYRGVKAPRKSGILRVIEEAGDRANLVGGLERIGPLEVLYTDLTELVYGGGIAQFVAIVDHAAKVVLGGVVDRQKTAEVALRAWRGAKGALRRLGKAPRGVIVHHDQGSAFISYDWARELVQRDGVRLSFALRGARDNPEMESFFGRFKVENRSLLLDATTLEELIEVVKRRIRYHNWERRHSSLGNQAPMRYLKSLKITGRPQ
jgi:putative transposase